MFTTILYVSIIMTLLHDWERTFVSTGQGFGPASVQNVLRIQFRSLLSVELFWSDEKKNNRRQPPNITLGFYGLASGNFIWGKSFVNTKSTYCGMTVFWGGIF